MPPVVYGLSSGTTALPSSALTIGRGELRRPARQHLGARAQAAAPGEDGHLLAGVEDVGRSPQLLLARACGCDGAITSPLWLGMFAFDAWSSSRAPVLDVLGNGEVGDAASADGRA